jgi:hypothetical protein
MVTPRGKRGRTTGIRPPKVRQNCTALLQPSGELSIWMPLRASCRESSNADLTRDKTWFSPLR